MKVKLPLFCKGDIGGLTYILANNIVNYIIVIATLSGVLGWPDEIVYGRVIPGLSMGLMVSGLFYAYNAYRLAQRVGHANVTALPSGVSTPAMFVILFGVIMPLHYALGDPEIAWAAAVAACFIGGSIEFLGGFIGPWLKKRIPRAALLGTVAGIGFIWMSTQGVFDLYSDPLVGLPILAIAVMGLFGGYLFPKRIPPFAVAIVGGIVYAYILGRTEIDFTGIGFYAPNPVNGFEALLTGFAIVIPYLSVIIPIEVYNFIETMDNVESANAAGDDYSVKEAQFADGTATMISALFGGVVPNTVWLGHAGLKKQGACIGFSWVGALLLGFAGIFGLFTFFSALVPPAVAAVTYLWCATIMLSQSFRACEPKHYAGVGIAMVPPIADYLYTQVTGAVGATTGVWTKTQESGLSGYGSELTQNLLENGVMWNGVPAVKAGSIIIGIILGTFVVNIIDRRLDKAAIVALAAAGLSCFGFIHSAMLGFYFTSPFVLAYVVTAGICLLMHTGRDKWFKGEDDFDYV